MERTIRNDYSVACAETVLDPAREIQPLFYHDDGIRAAFADFFQQFQYKCGVACGCVLHGVIVVLKSDRSVQRVLYFHAQQLSELVLAQRVGFAALGGIDAAVVGDALGQPNRRRAV